MLEPLKKRMALNESSQGHEISYTFSDNMSNSLGWLCKDPASMICLEQDTKRLWTSEVEKSLHKTLRGEKRSTWQEASRRQFSWSVFSVVHLHQDQHLPSGSFPCNQALEQTWFLLFEKLARRPIPLQDHLDVAIVSFSPNCQHL